MEEALAEFLRHLAVEKNASAHTVKAYREDLIQALAFFRERHAGQPPGLDRLNTRLLRAHQGLVARAGLRQDDDRPAPRRRSYLVPVLMSARIAGLGPVQRPARSASGTETAPLPDPARCRSVAGRSAGRYATGLARPGSARNTLLGGVARERTDGIERGRCGLWRGPGTRARQGTPGAAGPARTAGSASGASVARSAGGPAEQRRGQTRAVPEQERHALIVPQRRSTAGKVPRSGRGSTRAPVRTRCGTASPPICSTPVRTFVACKSCSDTAALGPPRYTPM